MRPTTSSAPVKLTKLENNKRPNHLQCLKTERNKVDKQQSRWMVLRELRIKIAGRSPARVRTTSKTCFKNVPPSNCKAEWAPVYYGKGQKINP